MTRFDIYCAQYFQLSRSRAADVIRRGFVAMDGQICTDVSKKITGDPELTMTDTIHITKVGRGYEKLDTALSLWNIDTTGYQCLDIGSSTGGFTQCLLQHGALSVDAVDVGTDQLAPQLRSDPRVGVFENTDIRSFVASREYDMIVCDVSFIPLATIIPECVRLSTGRTAWLLLCKPQFQVGKEHIKHGFVVDEAIRDQSVQTIVDMICATGRTAVSAPCAIVGTDGNQEYWIYSACPL